MWAVCIRRDVFIFWKLYIPAVVYRLNANICTLGVCISFGNYKSPISRGPDDRRAGQIFISNLGRFPSKFEETRANASVPSGGEARRHPRSFRIYRKLPTYLFSLIRAGFGAQCITVMFINERRGRLFYI